MELKKVRDFCWDCIMKVMVILTVAGILSSPVWISGAIATVRQISANKGSIESNALQIASLIVTMGEHGEEQEEQFDQIQKQLRDLGLLYGLATISEAGDEITAAINIGGPAVRLDEGQELWVTNRSDEGKTKIKVRVSGSFTASDRYLIRLSKEAGIAIEASKNEIRVVIEPIEEEADAD